MIQQEQHCFILIVCVMIEKMVLIRIYSALFLSHEKQNSGLMGSYVYIRSFSFSRDKLSADDTAGISFLHLSHISQLSEEGIF